MMMRVIPCYQDVGSKHREAKSLRASMPQGWHLLTGLGKPLTPGSFKASILSYPEGKKCQLLLQTLRDTREKCQEYILYDGGAVS